MASEIGVLELEIRDSSKDAGQGLNLLAGALVRVQEAVNKGLKMSNISRSLNTFAQAVQSNSKTLANVGSFLNAIEKYQKAFQDVNKIKFNAQPIKDLKEAIGDGIKLGQAGTQLNNIRTALEGEWKTDNAYQAGLALSAIAEGAKSVSGKNLGTVAKNVSAVASALEEYATASGHMLSVLGKNGSSSGSAGTIDSIMEGTSRYKVNLSQFGVRNGSKKSEGQIGMDLESMIPGLEHVSSTIQTANESVEQFKETVTETKSVTASQGGNDIVAPFDAVSEKIRNATDNLIKFNNLYSQMAENAYGNTPGNVQSGMELSTYFAPQWKPNWTYYDQDYADQYFSWKPDFDVVGEAYVNFVTALDRQLGEMADTMGWFAHQGFRLGAGSSPLLLGGGSTALSTHVEQPWRPDWIYGDSNAVDFSETNKFINGEGIVTISDEVSAAQEYADAFERVVAARQEEYEIADRIRKEQEAAFYGNAQSNENGIDNSYGEDIAWLDNLVEGASNIDLLNMKLDSMKDRLYEGATSGKMTGEQIASLIGQIQEMQSKIDGLIEAQQRLNSFNGIVGRIWDGLKKGIHDLLPTLSSLIDRFGKIAKYRMLRAVLKHITSGFTEGVKNVYQYSKAVGTDLAPAMDQAATSLQQMKNSIGAAAAPVIQALVPVLQNVVNWFIDLINYANQFFALINGQSTWTRALPEQAEAFEKSTKSAKGASKAMKDLLADWDELNIIQSQSGSGGGSGTGKTAEEYKNMFEEVNKFDESVKDTLKFIDEHLGGLPGILKKAGAIILGWKFSKAFDGFLGDLGKIIAGGAIVAIGLELSYGSGFSAGSKGSWETRDIVGAIGGALATAIGGSLITTGLGLGGGIGFAVGITVGVIATLIGYIQGQEDFMDKVKWGDQEMTPQQLKDYVKSRFSFDIEAEIDLLSTNIKNKETAKTELETKVNLFTQSLTLAKMKVGVEADGGETALNDAYTSAHNVIEQVQTYINENEKALTTTFSVSPLKDNNGTDITMDVMKEVGIANTTLKEYFIGLGKELADAMYKGEKDGWTDGEMEAVLALMEHQRNIVTRAEELQNDLTFKMNYKFNLNNLTRDNAKEIIEQEKALIEEHKAKFMQDRETAKEGLIQQLSWVQSAIEDYNERGLDTSELEKAASTYETLLNEYLDPESAEKAWQEKLEKSMETMRADWSEALQKTYGYFDREFKENRGFLTYHTINEQFTNELVDASNSSDPVNNAKKALDTYFSNIKNLLPDYVQNAMDTFGISTWNILNDDVKHNLLAAIYRTLGEENAEHLLNDVSIPISFEVEEDSLSEVKKDIEEAMKDGTMSVDEAFNIMLKHGINEYDQAMKELQYNLDEDGANRGAVPQSRMIASAGVVSDVGYGKTPYMVQPVAGTTNQADLENGVATGTARGNQSQNGLIEQLINICRQIAAKDFTVNIQPASIWGAHNAKSNAAYGKVTGVDVP